MITHLDGIQHDLALLRLPRPLTRPALRPLCLPPDTEEEEEDSFLGLRCVATGWGNLGDGSAPDKLMEVEVEVISNDQCRNSYSSVAE